MFNKGFNQSQMGQMGQMQMGQMGIGPMNMNPQMGQMGMGPMNMNPQMGQMNMNQQMGQMGMGQMNMNQQMNNNPVKTRITQEYELCTQDNDLIQIGCNFGLENNNIYTWRITMVGPSNTPYAGGLFTIFATFPFDYPDHGPEFKFMNKIYHLNVDFKNDKGHICLNSINEWRIRGKVKELPFYTMKQALFDIFCLFYNQGVQGAYDEAMANQYLNRRDEFNAEAKKWTEQFAKAI
jgi:ubiquitin-conjugating enzyme E2 D/E